jgi:mannose-6-phosphate isomerase-like protein (cupin superfamily)
MLGHRGLLKAGHEHSEDDLGVTRSRVPPPCIASRREGPMPAIPVICPPGGGDLHTIGPARSYVKITGADADGRLDVAEVALSPGYAGPPPHLHLRIDHIFYVLEGTLRVRFGRSDHLLAAGTCAFIPAGTPHTYATTEAASARFLTVNTPEPLDVYIDELASAFSAGTIANPEVVEQIQARYDLHAVELPDEAGTA